MIIDTTRTKMESDIEAHLLWEECFRTCNLVLDIQKHLDNSSVRQSFFSENLSGHTNIKYERYLTSNSAYYYKGKIVRVSNAYTMSPRRHENSAVYSFKGTESSLFASQIAQKLIDQEWDIMCQLLIACASKEVVEYPFGSAGFCQRSFEKFADKNVHMESQPLINPKDAHKCLGLNHYIECKSVPLGSMFLLPPYDELGAIGTTLKTAATQSSRFSGLFWTEATYSVIYGESIGWYFN